MREARAAVPSAAVHGLASAAPQASLGGLADLLAVTKGNHVATLHDRPPRERSKLTTLFADPTRDGPYTVWADVVFTRRKRHHCICDQEGEVVFRSRWWADVVEELARRGVERYIVRTDSNDFAMLIVGREARERD